MYQKKKKKIDAPMPVDEGRRRRTSRRKKRITVGEVAYAARSADARV